MQKIPIGWLAYDPDVGDRSGQIYRSLRERILTGHFPGGGRVPSSRALAVALGVGRSTVIAAYERLRAEGFLIATPGSTTQLADLPPTTRATMTTVPTVTKAPERLSLRLKPGVPDLSHFPHRIWARCVTSRSRALRVHDLGYGEACGLLGLRQAIVDDLAMSRGVAATADDVIIVPSASAAMSLAVNAVLKRKGGRVWIEDPGYYAARNVFIEAGAAITPIAVDREGLHPPTDAKPPRLIYVTPSHQYPTGVTLSLPRRLALIEVARKTGAYIIEDDYDSEFVRGASIAALQSIDRHGVVVYVGTFSKVLAPGLRVAYAIAPRHLLDRMMFQQKVIGAFVPVHIQAALFDFMRDGHYRAHLRLMRNVYREHARVLIQCVETHCADLVEMDAPPTGLQVSLWLRDRKLDDRLIVAQMTQRGFEVEPLSEMYIGRAKRGILVGMSQATSHAEEMARCLRRIIEKMRS